jgi:hypothetical protein
MLSESDKILYTAKFSIEWPESQLTENTALLTGVVIQCVRQIVQRCRSDVICALNADDIISSSFCKSFK